jgi:hypothetical protein
MYVNADVTLVIQDRYSKTIATVKCADMCSYDKCVSCLIRVGLFLETYMYIIFPKMKNAVTEHGKHVYHQYHKNFRDRKYTVLTIVN